MKNPLRAIIQEAATAIYKADTIFISAGAGMGVDSGLPDFRGDQGFWRAYPQLKAEQLSFQDLADPRWFQDDPQRAWGFYGHRFKLYQTTEPHEGFKILQKWVKTQNRAAFIFTSNVDGHFQKSGFSEDLVFECHGSINHLQCSRTCSNEIWPLTQLDLVVDETRLIATGALPLCPACSEVARPNILMFADGNWISRRSETQYKKLQKWKTQTSADKMLTIELGAGKAIPTVRQASESMPGKLIRINPRDSEGNPETISIPMGSLEALSAIDHCLRNGRLAFYSITNIEK